MTTVNRHSPSHSGLLVTGNGDGLDVELELIGGRTLRLSAAGEEIGAWPVDECHIEPDVSRGDAFRLLVDGDTAVFTPTDPIRFRAFADRVGAAEDAAREVIGDVDTPTVPTASVDDPVAFLFGSSPPPPTPQTPHVGVHPDPEVDPLLRLEPSIEEESVVDPLGTAEAVESLEEEGAPGDDRLSDDGEVDFDDFDEGDVGYDMSVDLVEMPAGAEGIVDAIVDAPTADAAPAVAAPPLTDPSVDELAADEMSVDELPSVDEASVDQPRVEGVSVDESLDGEYSVEEVGSDIRARFGTGSALDRLSEAIGSLKASGGEEYTLGPNTVAEDVIVTQRSLRDKRLREVARGKQLKVAAITMSVVGVVTLLALLAPQALDFVRSYEGGAELPPTLPVTETTVVATTTVADTTTPTIVPGDATLDDAGGVGSPGGTIFDRPAPEFVATWNAIGDPVSAVLRFATNPLLGPFQQQFTPYLRFLGEVEPGGTVAGFSLVVDPTGPAEHDRLGMQALGVAIATVDPSRSPAGRASLLLDLGLNVRQPILEGIDGTVTDNGIVYRLVYDPEAILLTFTVTPAG